MDCMKDFNLFEIEDLVMDEDFIRWVNAPVPMDETYWVNWLNRNPHKQLIIAEARRIVESIRMEQPVKSTAMIDVEIDKLLEAIGTNKISRINAAAPPARRLPWKKYMAAACIVLVIVVSFTVLFWSKNKKLEDKFYDGTAWSRQMVENNNTTDQAVVLALPDGSSVELSPKSRISYDGRFDSLATRDVYLSGQALFTVKKIPSHPFRVFANEIVAKVLGTSFSVRAFEKDTVIRVTVCTGKVSVYPHNKAVLKESAIPNKLGGIIVTPNQQLVYEKSSQEFQKILLKNPVMLSAISLNKSMAYEDASVDKVFNDLRRDYGINIVYDNELLKKCTVNADLSNESFYRKLDLICKAIGAQYEVIDAQVVIQSNGCE